jgi:3-oxoacyl-[acyl-carrier-protein] synthase-3
MSGEHHVEVAPLMRPAPLPAISLIGTASYLPPKIVGNEAFGGEASASQGPMFRGSVDRHHIEAGESAADMIVRATAKLAARLNIDPKRDVELILTNVSVPDMPFTGCGAVVCKRLGATPKFIVDVHNTGCVSFVYMMELARSLMATTGARTALICNAQTAAGRVFAHPDNLKRPQSAVPGDGCGVGFFVANDESPVKSIAVRAYSDYSEDMQVCSDDGGDWWAPRQAPLHIDFTESRVANIVARGNKLVPEIIREACADAALPMSAIDVLVTNQPNPVFLRNWRESLQLPIDAHVHTFPEHGNLFGAGIPISLERAEERGKLRPGSHVVLGGFSHAGDYAAAAVIHWRARG